MRQRPNPRCEHCQREGRSTLCRHKKPLRTKRRLTSRKRLELGGPIKPVNRARKKRQYERSFGKWSDTVREMACWWCERPGPSDPAHADPRGMGGCGGDRTVLLPMCRDCHDLYDDWKLAVDHDQAIADAKELHRALSGETA